MAGKWDSQTQQGETMTKKKKLDAKGASSALGRLQELAEELKRRSEPQDMPPDPKRSLHQIYEESRYLADYLYKVRELARDPKATRPV